MYIEEDPSGIKISSLLITDKDGKELLKREQTFQQVSENEFITSVNGDVYLSKFDGEKLIIVDEKRNNTVELDLNKINVDSNERMLEILKNVPANLLIFMKDKPLVLREDLTIENNAHSARGKEIVMGNLNNDNGVNETLVPVFLHEFGHHIDYDNFLSNYEKISGDKELGEIYEREYKAFVEATTFSQQKYVSYFTDFVGAAQERTAEATMILNGGHVLGLSARALYYQEFFPETIVRQAELIDALLEELNAQ